MTRFMYHQFSTYVELGCVLMLLVVTMPSNAIRQDLSDTLLMDVQESCNMHSGIQSLQNLHLCLEAGYIHPRGLLQRRV